MLVKPSGGAFGSQCSGPGEPIQPRGVLSFTFRIKGIPMRKLIILATAVASLAIAACNTVEGAGKDVSAAGHAVSDTAKDAK